eukprot:CAMPEP_0203958400 /NCGR_PEP_ID=MMETSP0359-20131031/89872_1 /ASSEMBLY_ACC=CAM_ASM_000338 /TAXON_ID=268821 /ORGANISM="Scrippsiella Hangoei, Strain SHTV-5" /LENGTH=161 /DNA_ID=CAMNT_0050892359 /DNA_START=70 /DNA_END=551 /DNA_ORIENTATION=+
MVVLSVALLLVLSLSAQASAGETVCAGGSGILSVVTDIAPVCFKNCQQLCGPLDTLITEYMATQDVDAIKAKVCAQKGIFDCVYEEGNVDECRKVLVAFNSFGVMLPMSAEDLTKQCPSTQAFAGEPACAGGSDILSMVTDIAPDCFKNCQQLCGPMDTLV